MQAVYEYPPKLSRAERQVKAAHDIEEHRKMQRNMYKNILLGAVISLCTERHHERECHDNRQKHCDISRKSVSENQHRGQHWVGAEDIFIESEK